MNHEMKEQAVAWHVNVEIRQIKNDNAKTIIIRPGITTLVGPNGSGKTRALRTIKGALENPGVVNSTNRKAFFLSAGRSSPLEGFRSAISQPGYTDSSAASVGHVNYVKQWWQFESVTGSLLALSARPDLRLKVEARLQQLLDRSVELSWSQAGLTVHVRSTSDGAAYAANHEASGVLQLVALLAAIHNDEISLLVIDEPEISLHPQHQAFILEEMESVAGDLTDPNKKLIVIATHSVSMLALRKVEDLPSIVFFNSINQPPAQVPADALILKRSKLAMLVSRLSTSHRTAMFAERVLMVEGISDEIVSVQLARRLGFRMLARNAQILPVGGKEEFVEAAKLFRLMNMHVAVLADLDALADDNRLVTYFSALPEAEVVANRLARKSLADLDKDLRVRLEGWMSRHEAAVQAGVLTYVDWSSEESAALSPRRVTLARLLVDPHSFGGQAGQEAAALCTQYQVLLGALREIGCFFLRRGAIENYYGEHPAGFGKPELAYREAATFEAREGAELKQHYADMVSALSHIGPNQVVDEDILLRPKLGAVLGAAFHGMDAATTDAKLNAIAAVTLGADAEIFRLANRSNEKELRLEVQITSKLFQRDTFPFEISRNDNANLIIPSKLPGVVNE